jgi:3-oxoacyl-[acyl-carrier protein] reductase
MSNKVALVTGGARGIPRAVALDLASAGWSVGICYRTSEAEATEAVKDMESRGGRGLARRADVSVSEEAEGFVRVVQKDLGPVSALVNGAGPYHRVPILEETPEGWREMFGNNLHAAFYMARLVAPDMQEAGWGRIVNFSMANADRAGAQPGVTAHYIAKSGLLILTRTLARKLAPDGITVNAVSPGFIDSGSAPAEELEGMIPKIPAKRLGTLDDAVSVVRFLFSEEADYVNGTNIHLSGGWGL